jgi:peptidoglycan/LPS O-acetylase OafA/YrhL
LVVPLFIFVGEGLPEMDVQPFYYLTFFLLGYFALGQQSFPAAALRYRLPALAGGVALCVFHVSSGGLRDSQPDPSWALAGLNLLGFLGSWLMIVGLVGLGRRYLDKRSPALAYLGEGSYPIYLLHQTVIVVLAFYLVQLPGPATLIWVILLASSVAVTFALYEGIRRLPVRVLFGMRLAPRRTPAPLAPATPSAEDPGRLASLPRS